MIKAYLKGEQREWDLHLGCLAAAYRATPHDSTGMTPNLIVLGGEVRLPAELVFGNRTSRQGEQVSSYGEYVEMLRERMHTAHKIARQHLGKAGKRQKATYDKKVALHTYQPGEAIWYLSESCKPGECKKLQPAYNGPYVVREKMNDLNYRIQTDSGGKSKIVHHNKLKPYEGDNPPRWAKPATHTNKVVRN
jgi:hypothetical protein